MDWTAVGVAIRREDERAPMEKLFANLQRSGLFSMTTDVVVVVDAVDDSGSGGSTINSINVLAEHLCARRGYTVLNDDVIQDSKILIVLASEPSTEFPLGRAFAYHSPDEISPDLTRTLPAIPFVNQIRNMERIANRTTAGVWLMSTEAMWSLVDGHQPMAEFSSNSFYAFCTTATAAEAAQHGTYTINDDGSIRGLAYREPLSNDHERHMILGLLYLPPLITSTMLSLASAYPLSRATYHGLDSGAIGLKLSLFFDIVYATCSGIDEFVGCRIAPEKIDCEHIDLLAFARRVIHSKLNQFRTLSVILETHAVQYLDSLPSQRIFDWPSFTDIVCHNLQATMSNRIHSVVPIIRTALASRDFTSIQCLFNVLQRAAHQPSIDPAVLLATVSEILWIWADGRGGLRVGPAANSVFARHFVKLEHHDTTGEGLRDLIEELKVGNWLVTPHFAVRAARHFEAAAQICTRRRVMEACGKHLPPLNICERTGVYPTHVRVALPARIDFYGGWLDTPPITLDTVSGVLNAAVLIDGERPLACSVSRSCLPGFSIHMEDGSVVTLTAAEVWNRHDKPTMQGALVCACLVACKLVSSEGTKDSTKKGWTKEGTKQGLSLEIRLESRLAHGSGLGSSSILAAACILALWEVTGIERDDEQLIHVVLYVEQILTTAGGWQDTIGGVYPGLKLARFCPNKQTVIVQPISVSNQLEKFINDSLVIIYTGSPRLAKNLLQEVVRSWLTRAGDQCAALKEMSETVAMADQWINGDTLPLTHIAQYYNIKKRLATGCEPDGVTRIIEALSTVSATSWLCGAGGGGYLSSVLRVGYGADDAQSALKNAGLTNLLVQRVQLCHDTVKIERRFD